MNARTPTSQADLAARYEELRSIAIAGSSASSSSSGFALLVERGVACWAEAWAHCAPVAVAACDGRRSRAPASTSDTSALVDVLTRMALASRSSQGAST